MEAIRLRFRPDLAAKRRTHARREKRFQIFRKTDHYSLPPEISAIISAIRSMTASMSFSVVIAIALWI